MLLNPDLDNEETKPNTIKPDTPET